MKTICGVALLLAVLLFPPTVRADALDDLARDFWAWRAAEMPVSTDDIPRLERPAGWVPDWSPASVARYQKEMEGFEARWKAMNASSWPVARQVDYRLMGSAIARVRWELLVNRGWQRNPDFYVDQTLGAYVLLLLQPPPFDAARSQQIVATLRSMPRTLEAARQNLTEPAGPFAGLALERLAKVRDELSKSAEALKPRLAPDAAPNLDAAVEEAVKALEAYREWTAAKAPSMTPAIAVGREGYVFFLKNVALLPYTPEQLLQIGRLEWARAVALETYEQHHNSWLPSLAVLPDQQAEIALEAQDEAAIRKFLETRDLLTVPPSMQHYVFRQIPPWLWPFHGAMGEEDDFTGPSRLKDPGIRYIVPPRKDLGYFALTMAEDPRAITVHEGLPGHYFQLALSWSHPDPIRRHYYDSGANEGIGFYAEEMMMNSGLFESAPSSPRTREIIASFMRLRALRVEVDVRLALGEFTLEQAASYLNRSVPMDITTAHAEAAAFSSNPGQAISYQIGKVQIVRMLAEARRQKGDMFSLRKFHDFVWLNGNVPLSLQRWELLGLRDDMDAAEGLR